MSTAKFDTLSNLAGTQTVPVDTVAQGSAKAWVNFNGTGTVAIRAAFNVSSITDVGTGQYNVNFTTAMPDANYAIVACATDEGDWGGVARVDYQQVPQTTSVRLLVNKYGGGSYVPGAQDSRFVGVAIFR